MSDILACPILEQEKALSIDSRDLMQEAVQQERGREGPRRGEEGNVDGKDAAYSWVRLGDPS
jgi:hypothetical protein